MSGAVEKDCKPVVGYLSGTFDLFHIGHLNILKRAKENCDYLVVGIHRDGSHKGKKTFIPFEERMEIVKSIKYVDEVIESEREDCDVYLKGRVKYDRSARTTRERKGSTAMRSSSKAPESRLSISRTPRVPAALS